MAYTDLSAAFYLLHTPVGNGAKNKFGICVPKRNEHFKPTMLLFEHNFSRIHLAGQHLKLYGILDTCAERFLQSVTFSS
jgi:hypothetical protein